MEETLSQFRADQLDIRLTNEKLFINTAISNEAFALRSLNGIGVVDLVDDYNKALTANRIQKIGRKASLGVGVIFGVQGLYALQYSSTLGFVIIAFCSVFIYFGLMKTKNEPKLMSAVRIMMSGGNRDFQFDKAGVRSSDIANFVAKVESTLTAYHQNNK